MRPDRGPGQPIIGWPYLQDDSGIFSLKNTSKASSSRSRQRRTQEDRSAEMRARLLKAAIDSLYARGYASTTTTVVCEAAKVSRGAMLHHFPTRVDLMLYVVKAVYEEEIALYRIELDPIVDPTQRWLMFTEVLWKVLGRPAGVAVLEIMQGARSDPTLSSRLRPLQARIERDSLKRGAELLGRTTGVHPDAARLAVWAIRGLSIAKLVSTRPAAAEKSVELLRDMFKVALDAGLFRQVPQA